MASSNALPALRPATTADRFGWTARFLPLIPAAAALGGIMLLWAGHAGYRQFTSTAGALKAIGRLTALGGGTLLLIHLFLISRVPWLERRYGLNRLVRWHRVTGPLAVALLATHAVTITAGYAAAAGKGFGAQFAFFMAQYPYLPQAAAALGLLLILALTSIGRVRRALGHERWRLLHVTAYAAVTLAVFHQIENGSDFQGDATARTGWLIAFGLLAFIAVTFRWLKPAWVNLRHQLRVGRVTREGPGVVSITLRGTHLEELPARAGQFFVLRFLTPRHWWHSHPFSLSSAPTGRRLRFTVKAVGRGTAAIADVRPGTRVLAQGPYGAFTAGGATGKLVLIAGGMGITPVLALLESLDGPPGAAAVIYRFRRREEAVLLNEVEEVAARKGFDLHLSASREAPPDPNPFTAEALGRLVPDVAEREAFVCGPHGMATDARKALRAAGVPARRIHIERFSF